jgi:hypothetical protein
MINYSYPSVNSASFMKPSCYVLEETTDKYKQADNEHVRLRRINNAPVYEAAAAFYNLTNQSIKQLTETSCFGIQVEALSKLYDKNTAMIKHLAETKCPSTFSRSGEVDYGRRKNRPAAVSTIPQLTLFPGKAETEPL